MEELPKKWRESVIDALSEQKEHALIEKLTIKM